MKTDTIVVHDNTWQLAYGRESEKIRLNQGKNFVEVHHIGSTAVAEIYAKPKIDMALIVKDLEESRCLRKIGYEYRGCLNIPFRYFYKKKTDEIDVHIHVLMPGDPELEGFLILRDYLNEHKETRDEYSKLKQKIKNYLESTKGERLLNEYTLKKNDFIISVLKKAGFSGYCMRLVSHYSEKEYEKSVYPNFLENDIRVIFYKGPEIIGYANANAQALEIKYFEVTENSGYFKNRFMRYLETLSKKPLK